MLDILLFILGLFVGVFVRPFKTRFILEGRLLLFLFEKWEANNSGSYMSTLKREFDIPEHRLDELVENLVEKKQAFFIKTEKGWVLCVTEKGQRKGKLLSFFKAVRTIIFWY